MIVADTSAMLALLNREDRHHEALLERYRAGPSHWVLPWATLPEIDYLVGRVGGASARLTFLQDVAAGAYLVEWGAPAALERAAELSKRYPDLDLGLVDATVAPCARSPVREGSSMIHVSISRPSDLWIGANNENALPLGGQLREAP